jgi:hypothetical protein
MDPVSFSFEMAVKVRFHVREIADVLQALGFRKKFIIEKYVQSNIFSNIIP